MCIFILITVYKYFQMVDNPSHLSLAQASASGSAIQNEKIPVDQIGRGTALVVDKREDITYISTAFLAQIMLRGGLYPALFTAGHAIFPDITKMKAENLKNIYLIFNNINGKYNIQDQGRQDDGQIQIEVS